MDRGFFSLTLFALAVGGCRHPSSVPSSPVSTGAPRVVHPEQLIIPPDMTEWPRGLSTGEFPHYPPAARSNGVEARVVMAFVIDENGRPEPRTISVLQSPGAHPEFQRAVCMFLRNGAEYSWGPQAPARALVVVPFEFTLRGTMLTEPLPPEPNLSAVRDSIRHLSRGELAAWVDSKPHCVS